MRLAPKSAEDRRALRLGGYGIPMEKAAKDPRSSDAAEVWSWEIEKDGKSKLYAIAFAGSAFKASWYYSFRNKEDREKRIAEFFDGIASWKEMRAKAKAERLAAPRDLEVGDVLMASWGYDQTNIDYYEVTKLIGKCMVEMREIAAESEETGFMSGRCVPKPGAFIEGKEPIRGMARNGSVKVREWGVWARKVSPEEKSYRSWYA